MEQNSEPVDTPLISMSQNQAQTVESTFSSQTTKVMKILEMVHTMVLKMENPEMNLQTIPLIESCMIAVKRMIDLEIDQADQQCLPFKNRSKNVHGRIVGQNVSGSATYSHHDCRIGEHININAPISLDQQESNASPHLEIFSPDLEIDQADQQCLPYKKRSKNVHGRIVGQNVSGSATYSHHDCRIEQININAPISLDQQESNLQRPAEGTSFEQKKDISSDDNHQDDNDAQNQLAVYSPADSASDGTEYRPSENQAYQIAPSGEAFTAQCSICTKWRFLPSKEKFEEIREHVLEQPFVCAAVREWRPELSCNDDSDIIPDDSRLWAMERPNIARPPLGWERLLRIRGSEGARFADVYYVTPSGKRLRSSIEVQRYLLEHPNEAEGVALSRFSFQTPKPLQKNFVKRRTDYVLALSHSSEVPQDRRKRPRMLSNRSDEIQQASLHIPTWLLTKARTRRVR